MPRKWWEFTHGGWKLPVGSSSFLTYTTLVYELPDVTGNAYPVYMISSPVDTLFHAQVSFVDQY